MTYYLKWKKKYKYKFITRINDTLKVHPRATPSSPFTRILRNYRTASIYKSNSAITVANYSYFSVSIPISTQNRQQKHTQTQHQSNFSVFTHQFLYKVIINSFSSTIFPISFLIFVRYYKYFASFRSFVHAHEVFDEMRKWVSELCIYLFLGLIILKDSFFFTIKALTFWIYIDNEHCVQIVWCLLV